MTSSLHHPSRGLTGGNEALKPGSQPGGFTAGSVGALWQPRYQLGDNDLHGLLMIPTSQIGSGGSSSYTLVIVGHQWTRGNIIGTRLMLNINKLTFVLITGTGWKNISIRNIVIIMKQPLHSLNVLIVKVCDANNLKQG